MNNVIAWLAFVLYFDIFTVKEEAKRLEEEQPEQERLVANQPKLERLEQ